MNNILFRIKYFIEYKNLSIRQFELSIGASNGLIGNAIKKNSDIQAKWISKIIEIYNINPTWLLMGEGPMLRTETAPVMQATQEPPPAPSPPACPICKEKERVITEKERTIELQQKTIALLEEQLRECRQSKAKEGEPAQPVHGPEPAKLK